MWAQGGSEHPDYPRFRLRARHAQALADLHGAAGSKCETRTRAGYREALSPQNIAFGLPERVMVKYPAQRLLNHSAWRQ
jgi:hypothetical protein